jgi:predicted RNA-binding Zn ribbon-like protein
MKSGPTFEFIAGSTAFNFVDTYGDRNGAGAERLRNPADLSTWLRAAGLLAQASVSERQLAESKALREAIHRCGDRATQGKAPDRADLDHLNAAARHEPLRPQLVDGELAYVAARPVEAAFSVIAEDALLILASRQRDRIRRCPGCGMLFIDTSPPGRRRWCSSSQGCGNRAKVRNLRARRALQSTREH